jgi:hypothetical protein
MFTVICLLVYIVFRSTNTIEGLETASKSTTVASGAVAGGAVAGGAADYVRRLTDLVTKRTDILLIDKYRTDYENAILKADDLINVLMLQQVLSIDTNKPDNSIMIFGQIAALSHAKDGLNKVMKFVDNAKSSKGGIFS